MSDRNGNVHTLTYDVLGRVVSDAVTTLGSGVDGAVRRIEYAYDGQGNAYLVTSYNAASGGSIVNQVQRAFNGLGQLITEYQEHGGAVNTSTSAKVQYGWSEMPSGANHSRLNAVTPRPTSVPIRTRGQRLVLPVGSTFLFMRSRVNTPRPRRPRSARAEAPSGHGSSNRRANAPVPGRARSRWNLAALTAGGGDRGEKRGNEGNALG